VQFKKYNTNMLQVTT